MSDRDLVEKCILELRKKTGYEDSAAFVQRDIEYLCSDIAEKTNIHISISTIKRLLNGQFSRLPQIATLNAITFYLGYDNWQDFKIKKKNANGSEAIHVNGNKLAENGANGRPPGKRKRLARPGIILVGVGVFALVVLSLIYYFSLGGGNNPDASFSFRKTTNNDIPNTVVFNYNIDKLEGDSFFIQQSWDKNHKVRIYKNNYTLTDIYYEPGFHTAKLIVNDKIIKTLGVSIPTNGWFFCSKDRMNTGAAPVYIKPANPVRNGILGLQPQDVIDSHIDMKQERNYIYSWFPPSSSVSSDNFMFSARIRAKEINSLLCPTIMLEIGCETNFIYFHVTHKGCTSNITAQFGEHFLDGKTTDLSPFGTDVEHWQNIEMMVMDKKATIFINQKEVFSQAYTQSSGLVTGLVFVSNGLVELDNVELTSLDGKVVFRDAFN